MSESRYNFRETEAKWQKYWQDNNVFAAKQNSAKPKYYVLEMFPYPSGNIHMGHVRNYALGDVVARTKAMQGYNVLHPMGWDAFGLPAENAAIERGAHPEDWTLANIKTMREQLKLIGLSYDWSRELATCLPDYYKHEQLFFLKFLEAGIAYRKEAEVNWDPVDNTVLANEQVVEGRGWRSGALVERRKLSQWFLRISDYAEDLLAGLEGLKEWPEKVRLMQEKWIGKSSGALLTLRIQNSEFRVQCKELEIYTTRPDTIFGMSFCAISPGHPLAAELRTLNSELSTFIAECNQLGTSQEAIEKAEKKGFDTGLKIIHPFDGREVPLYVANFVLMDYGTGAIFGCPAHDQRDYDFATKYGLPILPVVSGQSSESSEKKKPPAELCTPNSDHLPYLGDGTLINSPPLTSPPHGGGKEGGQSFSLNGLSVEEAKKKAIAELEKRGIGNEKINYRLRDWGISRQRYWGCPIPIIHCESCGIVPVPEKDLPVELPRDVTFDKPGNPLDRHPTWKRVPCPACQKPAQRETDTLDTFFESSWYFSRYATISDPRPLNPDLLNYWLPVDCYIGGIEHAVMHLLYSRFFSRALNQCGYSVPKEPFKRLETQGMICHETYKSAEGKWLSPDEVGDRGSGIGDQKEKFELTTDKIVTIGRSEKMSKSKKNTIDPRAMIETYGADSARLFMLSDSPPERDLEWTDAGIEGAWRYIQRLWKLVVSYKSRVVSKEDIHDSRLTTHDLRKVTHKTIAAVTDDIERFHFNKAIARIRELTNLLESLISKESSPESRILNPDSVIKETIEVVIRLLNPFMPHLAEELWSQLGYKESLTHTAWPVADKTLMVDDEVTVAIQINGKTRTTIRLPKDFDKPATEQKVLELQAVRDAIKDKTIGKIIVVPNRIINVVVQ